MAGVFQLWNSSAARSFDRVRPGIASLLIVAHSARPSYAEFFVLDLPANPITMGEVIGLKLSEGGEEPAGLLLEIRVPKDYEFSDNALLARDVLFATGDVAFDLIQVFEEAVAGHGNQYGIHAFWLLDGEASSPRHVGSVICP